jgi:hypothetical protein
MQRKALRRETMSHSRWIQILAVIVLIGVMVASATASGLI